MNYLDVLFIVNLILIAIYNITLYKDIRNNYGEAINNLVLFVVVSVTFFIEIVFLIILFKLVYALIGNF
tara:strand:- start:344 stop:550 length:207 start_codon:yes stop_codon:yes gene_type:complete